MDCVEIFLQWSIVISFSTAFKTNEHQHVPYFKLNPKNSRLTYIDDGKFVPIDYIFRVKPGLYQLTRYHPQDIARESPILKPNHPLAADSSSSQIFKFHLKLVRILTMDTNFMAFRTLIIEDHWLVNCEFLSEKMTLIFYTSVYESIEEPAVVDYFSVEWPIKQVKKIVQCVENDSGWCSKKIGGSARIYFETYDKGFIYTFKEAREIGSDLKPILVFSETRSMLSKKCTHEVVLYVIGYSYYILSFVDDKNAEFFHGKWFERTRIKIPIAVPAYVEQFLEKSHNIRFVGTDGINEVDNLVQNVKNRIELTAQ